MEMDLYKMVKEEAKDAKSEFEYKAGLRYSVANFISDKAFYPEYEEETKLEVDHPSGYDFEIMPDGLNFWQRRKWIKEWSRAKSEMENNPPFDDYNDTFRGW